MIVNPETDFPDERFAVGHVVTVEQAGRTTERRIAAVRFQQGRPVIALEGIETMNDAEALAGAELKVPRQRRAAAARTDVLPARSRRMRGPDEGRAGDREGTGVEGSLERSRLVIAGEGGEVLVPMVDAICISVDPVGEADCGGSARGAVGSERA